MPPGPPRALARWLLGASVTSHGRNKAPIPSPDRHDRNLRFALLWNLHGPVTKSFGFVTSDDVIAIVTYSETAKIALNATPARDKAAIKSVINQFRPDAGTNVEAGLLRSATRSPTACRVRGA